MENSFRFVLKIGQLKRIYAVVNRWHYNINHNPSSKFNWDREIEIINRARGEFLPVVIDCNVDLCNLDLEEIELENHTNVYQKIKKIELTLKCLIAEKNGYYNFSKPK